MAPRSAKRQRTGTGLGVQTTLDAAWDAEKLDDMMAMAQQVNPVAEPILTCITQKIEEHGGISHWIGSVTNSKDFQLSYARNLRSMFPPQASAQVTYLGASMEWPQSTLVGVQLWQLSWSEEDGFSMPSNDELLTMICAIINHGMRTNPAEHAGTEPLAVKMGKRQANGTQLTLFENSKGTEPVDGMVTVLPGVNIGGVGFVKGMKRSMGALAIAMAAMTLELDLAEKWPQLWSSLLVLWCTYVPYTSVESEFLANVAVAHKSAALRTRPTVFMWVHNIRNKMGKGAEATTQLIQRFNDANKLVADMQLSRKETQVVLTLAFNSSDSFVERLSAYLRKRPMRGSAITLDGLQSEAIRLGWVPKSAKSSAKWAEILHSTDASLVIAAERWIQSYENMPAGMRQRLGTDGVTSLVTKCNLLSWSLLRCKEEVLAEEFARIEQSVSSQFENGLLDDQLADAIEAQSEAFTWEHLPFMKLLLDKSCLEAKAAMERKEQLAADKVLVANLEDIIAQVEGDQARFLTYQAKKLDYDSDLVAAKANHQRRSRERGQASTARYLDTFCKIVPHLDRIKENWKDAKARPNKYISLIMDFINKARAQSNIRSDNIYVLHILDYNVFSGIDMTTFTDAVATSSSMNSTVSGQSKGASLVILPSMFGEVTFQTVIKHTRTIEDQLMRCGNDLSMRCSITYNDEAPWKGQGLEHR